MMFEIYSTASISIIQSVPRGSCSGFTLLYSEKDWRIMQPMKARRIIQSIKTKSNDAFIS